MKIDYLCGNPPFQQGDGGGASGQSSKPLYHHFTKAAIELEPEALCLIMPSRWFNGGKGLDQFREEMLNDNHIKTIVDYADSKACFPGVDIAGGICIISRKRNYHGDCTVVNVDMDGSQTIASRALNEFPTFIRQNDAVGIVKKIMAVSDKMMSDTVSSRKPFGIESSQLFEESGDVIFRNSKGLGKINYSSIRSGFDLIDKWKVIVSKVSFEHAGIPDKDGTMRVLSVIQVLEPHSVCSESYLVAGAFDTEQEALNLEKYLKTKFVRVLLMQMLASMNMSKGSYTFVPVQNYSSHSDIDWNQSIAEIDKQLFDKYGLNDNEIAYIESHIKEMQ